MHRVVIDYTDKIIKSGNNTITVVLYESNFEKSANCLLIYRDN